MRPNQYAPEASVGCYFDVTQQPNDVALIYCQTLTHVCGSVVVQQGKNGLDFIPQGTNPAFYLHDIVH